LGFEYLETMDYSDYEGADIIWNLNNANIPDEYSERYDFILDGGTLEHVFNIPSALEAVFKMLKVGGTFFFDQPAFFGITHGFYNFSPCFFYEYFDANKWRINSFRLFERNNATWSYSSDIYSELEISEKNLRKGALNITDGAYCLTWGSVTKTADTICTIAPQQPAYAEAWEGNRDKRLDEVFDTASAGYTYIYGTGLKAMTLIDGLSPEHRKALEKGGMLSISTDEIGKYFMYGVKIFDISTVKQGDTIIISSKIYQDLIYDRIKHLEIEGVSIVKLY
jgi:hypothetical protein